MTPLTGEGDRPVDRASRAAISPALLQHGEVWAAVGTWQDVVGSEPHQLVEVSDVPVTDLTRN